jgi:hypothetical protein
MNLDGQQITNHIASPRNPPSLEGDLRQEKQDLLLLEKSAVLLAIKHRHFSDNLKNP